MRESGNLRPPAMLRDAHYAGAKKLGHGEGYLDPHTDPRGSELDYLPEELKGGATIGLRATARRRTVSDRDGE